MIVLNLSPNKLRKTLFLITYAALNHKTTLNLHGWGGTDDPRRA